MEPLASSSAAADRGAPVFARPSFDERISSTPRSSRLPGTGFGHELLLALIMALVMTATVLLYR